MAQINSLENKLAAMTAVLEERDDMIASQAEALTDLRRKCDEALAACASETCATAQKLAAVTQELENLRKDPVPVGYWCLYSATQMSTRLAMYQRPTDKQIENTEKLLGWKWEDAK